MQEKGFFAALFDLSFTEFVTARLIKVIYVLALIGVGLSSLMILLGGFKGGIGGGLAGLVIAPIVFVLGALCVRIWLELIMVVFRIAENTNRLVALQSAQGGTGGTPPPEA